MADLGIAGGKGRGVIFRKGQVIRTVDEPEFLPALIEEGNRVIAEMEGREPSPYAGDDALIPLDIITR
jgi:(E)-4-hydroxy-3-methylbut-2-enyl-diphosphate synthase